MHLIGRILEITPDKLQALQERPTLVKALILPMPELDRAKLIAVSERIQEIAMRAENSASTTDPDELERARSQILLEIQSAGVDLPGDEPGKAGLCLEKSWHVLHFLITGKAGAASPPLGNAILGGTSIGDVLGHGPARYLDPQQVGEVADALKRLNPEDLGERFDPTVLLEEHVYGLEEEKFDMLEYYFAQVMRYYTDAAARGNGMLLYIQEQRGT